MVLAWLGIGVGVAMMAFSGARLVRWFRRHDRLMEATGVVIPPGQGRRLAPVELDGARRVGAGSFAIFVPQRHTLVHTGVHPRAARFRFTTAQGQVIESVSTFSSFPRPPEPGTDIEIVYDPADPQRTAERADVSRFVSLAQPLLFAFGAILALAHAMLL
jgi:hypothetical protein